MAPFEIRCIYVVGYSSTSMVISMTTARVEGLRSEFSQLSPAPTTFIEKQSGCARREFTQVED